MGHQLLFEGFKERGPGRDGDWIWDLLTLTAVGAKGHSANHFLKNKMNVIQNKIKTFNQEKLEDDNMSAAPL